ncbi:MAG: Gfo/Idh/MocA family protein [Thermoguttaceae bacterium]
MSSLRRSVRWGILGTGNIAGQFAEGLRSVPDAQLLAVGSRTKAKAEAFADAFAVPRAYESYEALVDNKDIDVVYIATPNHKHQENCLLALEAGKAVLCEKPFAVDAAEAREIIAFARRKHLFCMEAMWMRFLPAMARLRDLLDNRAIGEIRLVRADFGIPKPFAKDNRFFSREMGGGAMLNFGVYLVSFAFFLLGKPCSIAGQASFGATGVDEQSVAILSYPRGALAVLTASVRNYLPCEAMIIGTRGEIRIHPPLYRPERISVTQFPESPPPSPARRHWLMHLKRNALVREIGSRFDGLLGRLFRCGTKRHVDRFKGNGFNYEATEVTRCLRVGELESRIMPLDETLGIMETIDAIRSHLEDQPRAAW